jgi:membrane protease YdiL (CAAX protease family)
VTSAFYAYTHFKVPTSVWTHVPAGVHADTGFFVAYWTVFGITVDFDWAQFTTLWLLGMVLGSLVLRRGSLWPAIGLHAALVTEMVFLRGQGLANTPVAAIVLALIFLVLVFGPGNRVKPGS